MSSTTDNAQNCMAMDEVRHHIDKLDALLVPLMARRAAYVAQAARIKQRPDQVRDEERIEFIVKHVRGLALEHGMSPDLAETIYRHMMDAYIAFEHQEFARLRSGQSEKRGITVGEQP